MQRHLLIFVLTICSVQTAFAKDMFDHLRCGDNLPKVLVGRKTSEGTSKSLVDAYPDLQIKDLGGSGTADDSYHVHSWKICGEEFVFVYDLRKPARKSIISDVIQLPYYSDRKAEIFEEDCMTGEKVHSPVFGVFSDSKEKDAPAISQAWVLDKKTMKFKSLATKGLSCPRHP